jgi:hypothetical protein
LKKKLCPVSYYDSYHCDLNQQFSNFFKSSIDYIDGSEERNQIRSKMQQCFDGISVHGLPLLSIPDGEDVDYRYLNGRFKDGLATIANSIVERLATPK